MQMIELNKIYQGDVLKVLRKLPNECVDCVITSPPYYGLRDYGVNGQIGIEKTPEEYVSKMVDVFREVKRILKKEGTLWLNLGDSYWNNFGGGSKTMTTGNAAAVKIRGRNNKPKHYLLKIKDLIGIPWRVAFALQADGWYLRQDIIWSKPNAMPESVTDRCTKSHEYIFLLTKSPKYYFDNEAIKEPYAENHHLPGNKRVYNANRPDGMTLRTDRDNENPNGRNKRSVWTITTKPFKEAHFATFPEKLIEPMVKAGCPAGGICLDPFMGSGTTAVVARKLGRNYIGIELNQKYVEISERRLAQQVLL